MHKVAQNSIQIDRLLSVDTKKRIGQKKLVIAINCFLHGALQLLEQYF